MTASNSTPDERENVTEVQSDELNGAVTAEAFIEPSDATFSFQQLEDGTVTVSIRSSPRGLNTRLILTDEEAYQLGQRLIEEAE